MDISFLYAVSLFSQSFKELLLLTPNNPLSKAFSNRCKTKSRSIRERKDNHYFYSRNTLEKKITKTFQIPPPLSLTSRSKRAAKVSTLFILTRILTTFF